MSTCERNHVCAFPSCARIQAPRRTFVIGAAIYLMRVLSLTSRCYMLSERRWMR